jgi:hypothetical protein
MLSFIEFPFKKTWWLFRYIHFADCQGSLAQAMTLFLPAYIELELPGKKAKSFCQVI